MYGADYSNELAEVLRVLSPLFVFLGVVILLSVLLGLAAYLLRGFAINNMSKARGLQNGWFGFLPYLRDYQLGEIAGEIEVGKWRIKNTGLWLVLAPILYTVVFAIGYTIVMVPYVIGLFSAVANDTPEALFGSLMYVLIGATIFALVMMVAQVLLYLIIYLAYHKVFSQYATGQKPVFYLIIAMFVPLGSTVLLYMLSKRPLLRAEEAGQFVGVGQALPELAVASEEGLVVGEEGLVVGEEGLAVGEGDL